MKLISDKVKSGDFIENIDLATRVVTLRSGFQCTLPPGLWGRGSDEQARTDLALLLIASEWFDSRDHNAVVVTKALLDVNDAEGDLRECLTRRLREVDALFDEIDAA